MYTWTLFEYDHLCTDDGAEDTIFIDSDAFNALELFLCSQAANENINAEETHEVFRFSSRRGRKTLAAPNTSVYVARFLLCCKNCETPLSRTWAAQN